MRQLDEEESTSRSQVTTMCVVGDRNTEHELLMDMNSDALHDKAFGWLKRVYKYSVHFSKRIDEKVSVSVG